MRLFIAYHFFHNRRDMLQRGGVQLFHILNQISKLGGIGVAIIKELLWRDTEVFTDIEDLVKTAGLSCSRSD